MRKIVVWLIILTMALTLTACAKKDEPPEADPEVQAPIQNAEEPDSAQVLDQTKDANTIVFDSEKIGLSAMTKQDGSLTMVLSCEPLEQIYESDEEITFYWNLWGLDGKREELFRASAAAYSRQTEAPDGKWRIDLLEVVDEDEETHGKPVAITGNNGISLVWTRMLSEEKVNQIARFNVRLAVSVGGETVRSDIITFGREVIENVMK